jgi:hypothetical protein
LLHSDLDVESHLVVAAAAAAAAVLVELDKLVARGLRRCLKKSFEWDFTPASALEAIWFRVYLAFPKSCFRILTLLLHIAFYRGLMWFFCSQQLQVRKTILARCTSLVATG